MIFGSRLACTQQGFGDPSSYRGSYAKPRRSAFCAPVRAQFRVEGYNAFNHTQFSTYDSTARFDANGNQVNGQFGQFTAARDPRILQLAIRLQF